MIKILPPEKCIMLGMQYLRSLGHEDAIPNEHVNAMNGTIAEKGDAKDGMPDAYDFVEILDYSEAYKKIDQMVGAAEFVPHTIAGMTLQAAPQFRWTAQVETDPQSNACLGVSMMPRGSVDSMESRDHY